jgi:hypothetical protein
VGTEHLIFILASIYLYWGLNVKIVVNRSWGSFALGREQALAYGIPEEDLHNDSYYDFDIDRTDPKLVEIVEMSLPNSWASNLQVVELPDNCFYVIHNYDGMESITWSMSEIHYA